MKIPCEDCISFAICNAIVKKYALIYKTYFIISRLEGRCSLIRDWFRLAHRNTYRIFEEDIYTEFVKCYGIRLNVTPDYYLLRNLKDKK